ncbi:hypothetical protein [Chryseobacterium sp. MP_3.2]|uniref:hypothetical protein n=1 Tax=Chryseobacterium sp. MP_3.2 TaxID=3071712 RepID=UPI002E01E59B|nr:ribose/xylose/arabinose/galactoside ABC-type transport system permease subunit [Chryseobacterium sp. MP_3.2]
MNRKIIPALVSMVISFGILLVLSFFMSKFLMNSTQDFTAFFQEKWLTILAVVVIFIVYKTFFTNKEK